MLKHKHMLLVLMNKQHINWILEVILTFWSRNFTWKF